MFVRYNLSNFSSYRYQIRNLSISIIGCENIAFYSLFLLSGCIFSDFRFTGNNGHNTAKGLEYVDLIFFSKCFELVGNSGSQLVSSSCVQSIRASSLLQPFFSRSNICNFFISVLFGNKLLQL